MLDRASKLLDHEVWSEICSFCSCVAVYQRPARNTTCRQSCTRFECEPCRLRLPLRAADDLAQRLSLQSNLVPPHDRHLLRFLSFPWKAGSHCDLPDNENISVIHLR